MGKDENIKIFKDTEYLCQFNPEISASLARSLANQKLILETDELPAQNRRRYTEPAKVVYSTRGSLTAAEYPEGSRTAVLNFASATHPGGGVVNGASAQEESICRCCGLYFCLNTAELERDFYRPHRTAHNPTYNDDIIYTPDLIVFREEDYGTCRMRMEGYRYSVNIISCASPNLNAMTWYVKKGLMPESALTAENLLAVFEKRLRRIFEVALADDNENLVLGAWGCGAFGNDPALVVEVVRKVLPDYLYAFRNIEFALPYTSEDEEKLTRNYLNHLFFKLILESFWTNQENADRACEDLMYMYDRIETGPCPACNRILNYDKQLSRNGKDNCPYCGQPLNVQAMMSWSRSWICFLL